MFFGYDLFGDLTRAVIFIGIPAYIYDTTGFDLAYLTLIGAIAFYYFSKRSPNK